jgi:hypothetical protein
MTRRPSRPPTGSDFATMLVSELIEWLSAMPDTACIVVQAPGLEARDLDIHGVDYDRGLVRLSASITERGDR